MIQRKYENSRIMDILCTQYDVPRKNISTLISRYRQYLESKKKKTSVQPAA